MIKKFIIKKELNLELRNNTSLFLITPTMCVLIIVFPILSENRFRVENDMFVIVQLLFLIIFTTLFSIRNPLEEQTLIKELNFGSIKKIDYFYSKTISELGIFYPQIIFLLILFSGFTNTSINNSIIYIIFSVLFFCLNAIMVNLFFQMFTSFSSRFVQFILIVPIYIGFAILIAPMWLGVNQEISNIYLVMLLGITMVIYSFTNFYLRRSQ
ncbi:MAG: hypothetical protein ISQ16_02500 [Candidatus Actinomarina sp.]|jgi:hypothetical protein|nr:hypothetical protein [Candidatus Actinomarina sp.]MBL6762772.1 hypothetical protein [Candidatus Actinomarina sp.]MDA3037224.1 hypothetical protein [Actinomycetota bacterium]